MDFQMFKLNLEKAEEPKIKLPVSDESSKNKRVPENIYFFFIGYSKAFDSVDHKKNLKKWQSQTTLPVSWEMCMQDKKQQLELNMEQQTGFKLGKEYIKAIYCYPAYLFAEFIMQNARLDEAQAGIKISGRNINNLRYTDDTTLIAESQEELKSLLMKVKEESEKVGLQLNIQKNKIMASGPITSWQIDGETVETVRDIFLGGLQNQCRWWLQTWNKKKLAPWKKSYNQLRQHVKRQRYYFANKGPSSQGYEFSSGHVWMWELDCEEGWALKNWCFWTVVLEKTLESPLDCKEIHPVHPKGD